MPLTRIEISIYLALFAAFGFHLQNLAEKLARQHGRAGALSFYGLMGDDVQNFWRGIAKQIIDHAAEWEVNQGSGCVLSERERARLKALPRVPGGAS